MSILAALVVQVSNLGLARGQEVAVHEDELPQACPDGHLLGRLRLGVLAKALIQALEHSVLERLERLPRNFPQPRLH